MKRIIFFMKWVNGVSGNFVTINLTVFKHPLLGGTGGQNIIQLDLNKLV